MDGRLISCNDAGKILLDLRFDTRDTAVVYLHMSLCRCRAPEVRRVGASEICIVAEEKMVI